MLRMERGCNKLLLYRIQDAHRWLWLSKVCTYEQQLSLVGLQPPVIFSNILLQADIEELQYRRMDTCTICLSK